MCSPPARSGRLLSPNRRAARHTTAKRCASAGVVRRDLSQGGDAVTAWTRLPDGKREISEEFMSSLAIRVNELIADSAALQDLEQSSPEVSLGSPSAISKLCAMQEQRMSPKALAKQLQSFRTLLVERFDSLTDAFDALDYNQNGCIRYNELRNGLSRYRVNWMEHISVFNLRLIFEALDIEGREELQLRDWLRGSSEAPSEPDEEPSHDSPRVMTRRRLWDDPGPPHELHLAGKPMWSVRAPEHSRKYGIPLFSDMDSLESRLKQGACEESQQRIYKPADVERAWEENMEYLRKKREWTQTEVARREEEGLRECTGRPQLAASSRKMVKDVYVPPWDPTVREQRLRRQAQRTQVATEAAAAEARQQETFHPQILASSRMISNDLHGSGEPWHERVRRPHSTGRLGPPKQDWDHIGRPQITSMARRLRREGSVGERLHYQRRPRKKAWGCGAAGVGSDVGTACPSADPFDIISQGTGTDASDAQQSFPPGIDVGDVPQSYPRGVAALATALRQEALVQAACQQEAHSEELETW